MKKSISYEKLQVLMKKNDPKAQLSVTEYFCFDAEGIGLMKLGISSTVIIFKQKKNEFENRFYYRVAKHMGWVK